MQTFSVCLNKRTDFLRVYRIHLAGSPYCSIFFSNVVSTVGLELRKTLLFSLAQTFLYRLFANLCHICNYGDIVYALSVGTLFLLQTCQINEALTLGKHPE